MTTVGSDEVGKKVNAGCSHSNIKIQYRYSINYVYLLTKYGRSIMAVVVKSLIHTDEVHELGSNVVFLKILENKKLILKSVHVLLL